MSFTTIDITNMMRGEGEWKNMQEIVRRTLKICFDQMEKQGDQIALLTGQVASLKTQIVHKANRDELSSVNKLNLAAQLPKSTCREFATHAELDKLKDQVIHIRNDVERKASVRYVDESLRRKVDRSDLLVKNLATFSAAQYSSQLTQMFQELTETKAAVESLSHTTSDMQRNLQGVEDVHVVKHQMEAIYRSMGDYFTKNHIKALLDQKQDIAGLDAVLSKKADCSALQANMDRTEAALESHEKTITALRVKLNDASLFDARSTLARNTAQPLFSSSEEPCRARKCVRKRRVRASSRGGGSGGERKGEGGYVSSGYESSASTGSCICNHAEVGGGNDTAKTRRGVRLSGTVAGADMESVLRDGRVQALIEGLWTKVDNAEGSAHRLRQELDGQRGALSRIEATLSQVAGASQMETLGLVVEEQRRRIDSILTGSIPIESITEEFMRQQGDISELQAFLSLPQHKPLREQLAEAGDLIDVLSRKVAEQGAALGRAGLRIEAMEAINRQLETRVQMAENSREKVAQIQHLTDLAGTEFTSMKDLAKRLSAACAVLVGADTMSSSAMTSLAGKNQPVLTRVHSLETETAETESQLRQLETRLRELKQITVGICSTQGSRTGGSTATKSYSEPGLSPFSPSLGGSNFSPSRACESSQFHQRPAPSSPVRRGGETRFRGAPGLVVGESRPASPLRSPSLSPSHSPVGRSGARSGGNSSPGRRVSFPGEAGMDMCSPGAADADASRLSVDFEQALGQVFSSSSGQHDADAHVPVQQVAPLVSSTSRSAHAFLGFGASLGREEERPRGGSRVTVQTSSLRRVDERLDELKVEKERLRRLLMSKVESL